MSPPSTTPRLSEAPHPGAATPRVRAFGLALLILLAALGATLATARTADHADAPRDSAAILIDPNTASPAELQLLPGIGPRLAQRIAEHRDARGPFDAVERLDDVHGIGPKTVERLRPFLRFD